MGKQFVISQSFECLNFQTCLLKCYCYREIWTKQSCLTYLERHCRQIWWKMTNPKGWYQLLSEIFYHTPTCWIYHGKLTGGLLNHWAEFCAQSFYWWKDFSHVSDRLKSQRSMHQYSFFNTYLMMFDQLLAQTLEIFCWKHRNQVSENLFLMMLLSWDTIKCLILRNGRFPSFRNSLKWRMVQLKLKTSDWKKLMRF